MAPQWKSRTYINFTTVAAKLGAHGARLRSRRPGRDVYYLPGDRLDVFVDLLDDGRYALTYPVGCSCETW